MTLKTSTNLFYGIYGNTQQQCVVCDGETAGVRAAADDQWMASEWVA